MSAARIAAVVLAGGDGTRLGAAVPKPLVLVGGRPMIAHVLDRVPAAVCPVLISANDSTAFAGFGRPVLPDRFTGRKGPLAGLDAATAWLRQNQPAATHLLGVPGDTPFLTADTLDRLTVNPCERVAMACFGNRPQPTVALWPLAVLDALATYLPATADLSLMRFAARAGDPGMVEIAPTRQAPGGDPFFNVNTPADLETARMFLGGGQG